ncbi:hypothetical protein, partial [Nocardia gipuzkoensis]|uniref:hypothetical protein n=1 Tax=Nocardia gipuzkoensis TaxID=2749991 RepID=UPI002453DC66
MFTIPTGVAAGISYDTLPTILSRSGIAPQVTAAYGAPPPPNDGRPRVGPRKNAPGEPATNG